MDMLILQVFVSLVLGAGGVILFGFTCRQRSFEHSDRLALLPVEDDAHPTANDANVANVTRGNES